MYSFLLVTTLTTLSNGSHQAPPVQERLVPIPQPTLTPYIAERRAPAPAARSDAVLHWNEAALSAIRAERTPPPLAARNLAILHAAMFDAVNAVTPTYRSFRTTQRAQETASAEVAAAIAAHRVLLELYPRRAEACDTALDAALESIPDGPAKEGSVALGQRIAEEILTWRASDGANRRVRYEPQFAIGLWRPTPPAHRAALLPQWRYLTPFAIPNTASFMPARPPALDSSAYTTAFREVKDLGRREGSTRTAEQTLIARFWDDGEGSITPPGHWNRIAQTVSRERGMSLAENARLFALLNISMADAAILCWEGKFAFSYWRPITAIREADQDGNPDTQPDRAWDSLLTTPPFPSYASGHSTFSGAAATALARFFGTDAIRFRIDSEGTPGETRAFDGFWAAAQEAGRSRIYGGIHYEFDNTEGLRTGRELADYIARRYLLPLETRSVGEAQVLPTNRRHFSINLADRPRGQQPPPARGR